VGWEDEMKETKVAPPIRKLFPGAFKPYAKNQIKNP
jgi:hypothetical protein